MCGKGAALVEVGEGLRAGLAEGALEGLGGKGVVVEGVVVEGVVVEVVVVVERVGLGEPAMGPLASVAAAVRRLAEGNPRAYSSGCALGLQVHPVGTDP